MTALDQAIAKQKEIAAGKYQLVKDLDASYKAALLDWGQDYDKLNALQKEREVARQVEERMRGAA
mgnify:CR=1 FL=1